MDMIKSGPTAVEPSAEDMKRQVEALRKDVRILAGMARRKASGAAHELKDAAQERVEDLSDEAARLVGDLRGESERLYGEAEDLIRRHPMAAAGAAFLVGWLIGGALRR